VREGIIQMQKMQNQSVNLLVGQASRLSIKALLLLIYLGDILSKNYTLNAVRYTLDFTLRTKNLED